MIHLQSMGLFIHSHFPRFIIKHCRHPGYFDKINYC